MIIQLDLTLIDDEFYFNSITPVHKYTALNYNFKTTKVYILSKCKQTILDYCNHELNKKTGHEFRDRRVLKNEILDLNNLIILCENDLKGYEINISNIKINEALLNNVNKRKSLEICMVPFCNFDMNLWQSLIYTEKLFGSIRI